MRPAADVHAIPAMLDGANARASHGRHGEKMRGESTGKRLDVIDRILPRERVDRVLHRVGRDAGTVVAVDVDAIERALELDVDGDVDDLMPDVIPSWCPCPLEGPAHFHQAHARLAVAVPRESRHRG